MQQTVQFKKPNAMSASHEIQTIKALVKQLLTDHVKYRNNDKMLCCRVWKMQLEPHRNIKTLATYDFFDILCNQNLLSSADSITRAARNIKVEFPELEGDKQTRLEEVPLVQNIVRTH